MIPRFDMFGGGVERSGCSYMLGFVVGFSPSLTALVWSPENEKTRSQKNTSLEDSQEN